MVAADPEMAFLSNHCGIHMHSPSQTIPTPPSAPQVSVAIPLKSVGPTPHLTMPQLSKGLAIPPSSHFNKYPTPANPISSDSGSDFEETQLKEIKCQGKRKEPTIKQDDEENDFDLAREAVTSPEHVSGIPNMDDDPVKELTPSKAPMETHKKKVKSCTHRAPCPTGDEDADADEAEDFNPHKLGPLPKDAKAEAFALCKQYDKDMTERVSHYKKPVHSFYQLIGQNISLPCNINPWNMFQSGTVLTGVVDEARMVCMIYFIQANYYLHRGHRKTCRLC